LARDSVGGRESGRELGLPEEIDVSSQPGKIQALARQRASREEQFLGRWYRTRYRAISSADGNVEAIAFVRSDIHEHKLAGLRLELLSRLSAMVGNVDYEDVTNALASIPVPEFADWCTVNLIDEGRIVRTSVSHCVPNKATLRDAVMGAAPKWNENPLWTRMKLTRGFQLLADVSDDLLRKLTLDAEQYGFMKQMGLQSILVQPVVSRGQIVAIVNLMYTTQSGRRYGLGDPELAAEMALHAAHIIENARLLRDLRATEARFRVSLAGAKTAVFEQDSSLRYRWLYYGPLRLSLVGRTDEEIFPADEAVLLTALKRRRAWGNHRRRIECRDGHRLHPRTAPRGLTRTRPGRRKRTPWRLRPDEDPTLAKSEGAAKAARARDDPRGHADRRCARLLGPGRIREQVHDPDGYAEACDTD
jgi:hypothetical protein